ncbi:hypothetical protein [Streptomyces sp. SID14478]|uniref:hypothetical protein n=1 Tax=Streptomyces sp. SID14478 TaxID=2706073 RepID=UPI001944DABE|nr:hypothetical protein [Streptomyces sp. SID14478]
MPAPSLRPGDPPASGRIRALKALRPALTAHCRGLAFVARTEEALHSGQALWGCPTTATQHADEARAWARARVEA